MKLSFDSEAALVAAATDAGRCWRGAGISNLLVGLSGELGAGKTSFARALLGGLGHTGRVPSPTYTLLEHYELGALTVVHLDLYRLAEPRELDFLGLTDFLALPAVWVLAEWPEKGGAFAAALDLTLTLDIEGDERRTMRLAASTATGRRAAQAWLGPDFK
jgi:tRNA threonylcarbamoyladenosine biosynthesis protein TsaE